MNTLSVSNDRPFVALIFDFIFTFLTLFWFCSSLFSVWRGSSYKASLNLSMKYSSLCLFHYRSSMDVNSLKMLLSAKYFDFTILFNNICAFSSLFEYFFHSCNIILSLWWSDGLEYAMPRPSVPKSIPQIIYQFIFISCITIISRQYNHI